MGRFRVPTTSFYVKNMSICHLWILVWCQSGNQHPVCRGVTVHSMGACHPVIKRPFHSHSPPVPWLEKYFHSWQSWGAGRRAPPSRSQTDTAEWATSRIQVQFLLNRKSSFLRLPVTHKGTGWHQNQTSMWRGAAHLFFLFIYHSFNKYALGATYVSDMKEHDQCTKPRSGERCWGSGSLGLSRVWLTNLK